jgi:hypothetical protein
MGDKNYVAPLGGTSAAEDVFKIYTSQPLVRFLSRGVQPPSQVYIDTSDVLIVGCATSMSGEVLTVSYRVLRADGQLVKGQFQILPASDRSISIHQEPLPEGFLLSVSCKAAVATTRGQTFARVFLTDPVLGAGQPSYMLMADYVTTAMAPAHPNGRVLAPSEGPGAVVIYTSVFPAPATDPAIQVPTNARWRLLAVRGNFRTSAVVVNRMASLVVATVGTPMYSTPPTQLQPAGIQSLYCTTCTTLSAPIAINVSQWPLPNDLILLTGQAIQTLTLSMDAADQWFPLLVQVEEWLDNV